jgi:hypothetical protein
MILMFENSPFNQDIENWNISNVSKYCAYNCLKN